MKIIQKQVKQRKDSAAIFIDQGRQDLADPELAEIAVLEKFLPEALSEDAIEKVVLETIAKTGAEGMKDMGKVMGELKKLHADEIDFAKAGPLIKELLNS